MDMGVPKDRAQDVLDLIIEGAEKVGFLQLIKDRRYVDLTSSTEDVSDTAEDEDESTSANLTIDRQAIGSLLNSTASSGPSKDANSTVSNTPVTNLGYSHGSSNYGSGGTPPMENRRVFITHGRNQSFIEPIKKLLKFGEMEAIVAAERQSVSMPVPEKVMSDMRSCTAAIIHVDAEEVLLDKSAQEHVVLNPNVLIEIGAAMALYGRRFILLVKKGVKLPSNLQGLYEVRYEGDSLDGDTTIRLLEAINQMKSHPVLDRYNPPSGDVQSAQT